MTDELTPQEREALQGLPRERMPSAALEERVVGAMRARGFVAARPSRVVRITNSRVAGLLAACIVLIVGAYAIGLHRGGDNPVLRSVELPQSDVVSIPESSELGATAQKNETIREPAESKKLATTPSASTDERAATSAEQASRLKWRLKTREGRSAPPALESPSEQALTDRSDQPAADALAKDNRQYTRAFPSPKEKKAAPPSPQTMAFSNSLQAGRAEESAGAAARTQSFTLGGS
jgi:hypothetical protein